MKNKHIKTLLTVFTVIFALRVVTIFAADRLYSMSLAAEVGKIAPDRAVSMLDAAIKLDSANAELYYKKYEILNRGTKSDKNDVQRTMYEIRKRQLNLLKKAINFCPSWPAYHLRYALTLKRMVKYPNVQTRELILSELKKAVELKPFSELYMRIYKKYVEKLK